MKIFRCLLLCLLGSGCNGPEMGKLNGVSFVASREMVTQENIDAVRGINAGYAAIMPFGFIRSGEFPQILFNSSRQWFGETAAGAKQYIGLLHKNGLKVMVKPQIWISRGEFTGNLKMDSEDDWRALEESYGDFILTYAALAQEANADMFCVGTELEQFVVHRPGYWRTLIKKVRKIYRGRLTYAANWDEYGRVPFWDDLDFIGIDAYFPLSDEKTPTVGQLRHGWQRHKEKIKDLSLELDRPVLFTEYGYRSSNYTARRPWSEEDCPDCDSVNLLAQSNATKAILEEFWKEDWFAGGFVWKWFIDHERAGGSMDNRFTPQNKPAQEVIKNGYALY